MNNLTSDPTPVTPKQHKWVRRVVGALSYYANTTRLDISYEANRVAQYLQAPTLGTVKAIKRIITGVSCGHGGQGFACGKSWDNRLADIL